MGLTTAGQNDVGDDWISGKYVSLGSAPTTELAGITRIAHTYAAFSAGESDLASTLEFTVPVGGSVLYWQIWSASTSGTLLANGATTVGAFPGGGIYKLDSNPIEVL